MSIKSEHKSDEIIYFFPIMPYISYKQFQKLVQSHKSCRDTILRCLLILSNGHPGKDVSGNLYYPDEKATPRQ